MEDGVLDIIYDNSNEAEQALREHSSNRETNDNASNKSWDIPDPLEVFVVKINQCDDSRAAHEHFQQAKIAKADGLVWRKIWHKVSCTVFQAMKIW